MNAKEGKEEQIKSKLKANYGQTIGTPWAYHGHTRTIAWLH